MKRIALTTMFAAAGLRSASLLHKDGAMGVS